MENELNTGWSRIRQLIATLAVCGGGVYAAYNQSLTWQLVALLSGGLLAYTSKSVLQEAVKVVGAYYKSKLPQ